MTTAVEWLQMVLIPIPYDEEDVEHNKRCWEQAKEMDKQQIFEETSKRIGLMEIELNHTKRLLASCEKALEDRDNKYLTFKPQEQ
jgi:hypothetical protein